MELGEIHLGLFAGSCFEPNFKPVFGGRADVSEKVRNSSVAAGVSAFLQLSQEPPSAKAGIGCNPFTQIRSERINDRRPRLPWPIGRCLKATLDIFADCLSIDAGLPGDRRHRQALPV